MVVATLQTTVCHNMFPLRNWQLRYMAIISRAGGPRIKEISGLATTNSAKQQSQQHNKKILGCLQKVKTVGIRTLNQCIPG